MTDEAKQRFGQWVVLHDWTDVILAEGSSRKADIYQSHINWAMDEFFPLKKGRRKFTDLPWINKAIRKKIRRRMRIYVREGRSELWKRIKKETDEMIKKRKHQ